MKLPKFYLMLLTSIALVVPAIALVQSDTTSNHWKNISTFESATDFPRRLVREMVGSTLIINPISVGFGCLFVTLGAVTLIWIAFYASAFRANGNTYQPYLRYGNPDIPFYRFDHPELNFDLPNSYSPPPKGWHLSPKELLLAAKVHDNMRRFENQYPSS